MSYQPPPHGGPYPGPQPGPPYPVRQRNSSGQIFGISCLVIAVVGIVGSLACFGVFGLMIFAMVQGIEESMEASTPVSIEEGQSLRSGDFRIEEGWQVQLQDSRGTITGLRVTNREDVARTPDYEFTLYLDATSLDTVRCIGDESVEPGESVSLSCDRTEVSVRGYDQIKVAHW